MYLNKFPLVLILFLTWSISFGQNQDCNGVENGSALTDDCGVCQSAYVYDFTTHQVSFVENADSVQAGPTETVVLANDSSNPYWNQSCSTVSGCTDSQASNFSWMANEDDGSCIYPVLDCNNVENGSALTDDCGVCQSAYLYDFTTHQVSFVENADSAQAGPTETLVLANDPSNSYWNASCLDCNDVANGSALTDDCGVCQSAYVYDFTTHQVSFVENADSVQAGPTETVVLANDSSNPYWNQSCSTVSGCTDSQASNFSWMANEDDGSCIYPVLDCNNVENGSALTDDCGVCQSAYLYDFTTHQVSFVENADSAQAGPTETLVLANDPSNSYWNASCLDCNDVANGSALTDDCGVCQSAYVYDFTTHQVSFVENADSVQAGPTETVVLANDSSNPYWNQSCSTTSQSINLPSGWSMFSTYIKPEDPSFEKALKSIESKVLAAKRNDGEVHLPQYNYYGIDSLKWSEGYQIKMDSAMTLTIEGTYADPATHSINLEEGWNMIGVLSTHSSTAGEVFTDIVAENNLIISKDYMGLSYFPQYEDFGNWNTIVPGQGYQLKVHNADVLTYASGSERRANKSVMLEEVKHFEKPSLTDNNMTVVIEDAAWDAIPEEGSEVAAYDQAGNLIGSAVYSSPVTVMSVWGDDETTSLKDGLNSGETVQFKIYSEGKVDDLLISSWDKGSSTFNRNSINVASSIKKESNPKPAMDFFNLSPNPANSNSEVSFHLSEATNVELSVYSILGEKIQILTDDYYSAGTYHLNLELATFKTGTYLLKMMTNSSQENKQLQIIK